MSQNKGSRELLQAGFLLVYIAIIVFLAAAHEPWLDEIIAWDQAVNRTPLQIIQFMAVDGHFVLWHFLLLPFAKAGLSCTLGLPIVSCTAMGAAAWWVIYRSDFSRTAIAALLLSYPVIYFFPVVSRCYALIPLILWLLAALYPRRMERPVAYGICLGLLFNTHLYMEGLAAALLLTWGLQAWEERGRQSGPNRRIIAGLSIALSLGILAFAQVVGNLFLEKSAVGTRLDTVGYLTNRLYQCCFSTLMDLPELAGRNGGYFKILLLTPAVVAFGWLYYRLMRRHKLLLGIVIFSIAYQVFFALFLYKMGMQRIYLPLFISVFGLWAAGEAGRRGTTIFLVAFFLCGLPYECRQLYEDITGEYATDLSLYRRLAADEHPVKYISGDIPMRRLTTAFGPDTIAGKRFPDYASLIEMIRHDRPDSLEILDLARKGEKPEEDAAVLAEYDTLRAALLQAGYELQSERSDTISMGYFHRFNCRSNRN